MMSHHSITEKAVSCELRAVGRRYFFLLKAQSPKPKALAARRGYVFLITILIIGSIASATVASMLLLATTSARTTLVYQQSVQALAYAQTCVERALRELRLDGSFTGNMAVTFGQDSCRILSVTGTGNENRGLCTEGKSGTVTRRIEVTIDRILPSVIISSWKEVSAFTLCSS